MVVIVSGSAGLIGSETVRYFADKGLDVVGIDNNMRAEFFGKEASTEWNQKLLELGGKEAIDDAWILEIEDALSKISPKLMQ